MNEKELTSEIIYYHLREGYEIGSYVCENCMELFFSIHFPQVEELQCPLCLHLTNIRKEVSFGLRV